MKGICDCIKKAWRTAVVLAGSRSGYIVLISASD